MFDVFLRMELISKFMTKTNHTILMYLNSVLLSVMKSDIWSKIFFFPSTYCLRMSDELMQNESLKYTSFCFAGKHPLLLFL